MIKKLNAYFFNNAEYEDIYLCDEHDDVPMYGMWVKDTITKDPKNDIFCQECGEEEDTTIPPGFEWEKPDEQR